MSDTESVVSDDVSVASEVSGEGLDYDFDERSQASRASKASKGSRGKAKKHVNSTVAQNNSDDYGDYSADFVDDFDTDDNESRVGQTSKLSPKGINQGSGKSSLDTLLPPRASNLSSGREPKGIASPRNAPQTLLDARNTARQMAAANIQDTHRPIAASTESTSGVKLPMFHQQSLQTEIVLEEISKEVIAMRNLQRQQLKERQATAKEKRARAEERRRIYEQRLQEADDTRVRALAAEQAHVQQVKAWESQIKSLTESKDVVTASLHAIEGDAEKLRTNLAAVNKELRKAVEENGALSAKFNAARSEWSDREAVLTAEVKKCNMLQATVQKSIEASEARFAKEREQLPVYQAQALKEQQERLQQLEGELNERAGALRQQESYKLAAIETMRKEAREEIMRMRSKVDADLALEKADAHALLTAARSERAQWDSVKAQEIAQLEQAKLSLTQRERELTERAVALDRQAAEFEGARRMLQPTLDAAARERREAAALKEQADRVLLAAEEHTSSVLAAERGLIRREQELQKQEQAVKQAQAAFAAQRKALATEQARCKFKRQVIETDRFRLHQASMDLASQVVHVNRENMRIQQLIHHRPVNGAATSGEGVVAISTKYTKSDYGESENVENQENNSMQLIPTDSIDDAYPGVHTSLQNVSVALERILQSTATPPNVAEENEFSPYGSLGSESAYNVPPQPPQAAQTALQLLDEKLSTMGFTTDVGPRRSATAGLGHDDLRSSIEGVSTSSANMAAIASRYGVYANVGRK